MFKEIEPPTVISNEFVRQQCAGNSIQHWNLLISAHLWASSSFHRTVSEYFNLNSKKSTLIQSNFPVSWQFSVGIFSSVGRNHESRGHIHGRYGRWEEFCSQNWKSIASSFTIELKGFRPKRLVHVLIWISLIHIYTSASSVDIISALSAAGTKIEAPPRVDSVPNTVHAKFEDENNSVGWTRWAHLRSWIWINSGALETFH